MASFESLVKLLIFKGTKQYAAELREQSLDACKFCITIATLRSGSKLVMRGINGKKEWIFLEMNYYRNCKPKFENRLKEMRLIILRKRKKRQQRKQCPVCNKPREVMNFLFQWELWMCRATGFRWAINLASRLQVLCCERKTGTGTKPRHFEVL